MPETLDLNKVAEDIVASYEVKIENIKSFFETTHLILNEFQDPLFDIKEERQVISAQLQDLLAKNEHLRKKDFDSMMRGVLSLQEEREKEARSLLRQYFDEEKGIAQALRNSLREFKNALGSGEAGKLKEIHSAIKELLAKQDARRHEIASRLKEFQKEQQQLPQQLKELLAKGEELRVKDFKLLLNKIKTQRLERLGLQKKRKEDVAKMLQDFKRQRQKPALPQKAVDIDAGKEQQA